MHWPKRRRARIPSRAQMANMHARSSSASTISKILSTPRARAFASLSHQWGGIGGMVQAPFRTSAKPASKFSPRKLCAPVCVCVRFRYFSQFNFISALVCAPVSRNNKRRTLFKACARILQTTFWYARSAGQNANAFHWPGLHAAASLPPLAVEHITAWSHCRPSKCGGRNESATHRTTRNDLISRLKLSPTGSAKTARRPRQHRSNYTLRYVGRWLIIMR